MSERDQQTPVEVVRTPGWFRASLFASALDLLEGGTPEQARAAAQILENLKRLEPSNLEDLLGVQRSSVVESSHSNLQP